MMSMTTKTYCTMTLMVGNQTGKVMKVQKMMAVIMKHEGFNKYTKIILVSLGNDVKSIQLQGLFQD